MNYITFPGIIETNIEETLKIRLIKFCQENPKYQFIASWDQVAICGKKNRKPYMVLVRQMYHYLIKRHTSLSLKEIGDLTGGHDHTTVMYSITTIQDLLYTKDPETMKLYNYLNI